MNYLGIIISKEREVAMQHQGKTENQNQKKELIKKREREKNRIWTTDQEKVYKVGKPVVENFCVAIELVSKQN